MDLHSDSDSEAEDAPPQADTPAAPANAPAQPAQVLAPAAVAPTTAFALLCFDISPVSLMESLNLFSNF